jgi:hypothetical protein
LSITFLLVVILQHRFVRLKLDGCTKGRFNNSDWGGSGYFCFFARAKSVTPPQIFCAKSVNPPQNFCAKSLTPPQIFCAKSLTPPLFYEYELIDLNLIFSVLLNAGSTIVYCVSILWHIHVLYWFVAFRKKSICYCKSQNV